MIKSDHMWSGFLKYFFAIIIINLSINHNASHAEIYDRNGHVLDDSEAASEKVAWALVPSDASVQFNGVAKISGVTQTSQKKFSLSNCSGFIIDSRAEGKISPVYLITNGHCISIFDPPKKEKNAEKKDNFFSEILSEALAWRKLKPKEKIFDYSSSEVLGHASFKYYNDSIDFSWTVPIKCISFATLTGTDLAILKLDISWDDVLRNNILPFKVSTQLSDIKQGDSSALVGVAPDDLFPADKRGLRKSVCTHSANFNFTMDPGFGFGSYYRQASFRHTCSTISGLSGSPILSVNNDVVLGVNLGSDHGQNIATRISGIAECFNEDGYLKINSSQCFLRK